MFQTNASSLGNLDTDFGIDIGIDIDQFLDSLEESRLIDGCRNTIDIGVLGNGKVPAVMYSNTWKGCVA